MGQGRCGCSAAGSNLSCPPVQFIQPEDGLAQPSTSSTAPPPLVASESASAELPPARDSSGDGAAATIASAFEHVPTELLSAELPPAELLPAELPPAEPSPAELSPAVVPSAELPLAEAGIKHQEPRGEVKLDLVEGGKGKATNGKTAAATALAKRVAGGKSKALSPPASGAAKAMPKALVSAASGAAKAAPKVVPKAASPGGGCAGKVSQGSSSTTASQKAAAPPLAKEAPPAREAPPAKQVSPFDTQDSMLSTFTAFDTLEAAYQEMTREERKEARELVKDFVKGMVRGREFSVIAASGELRTCFCSLSRKLDKLKVSLGDKDRRIREIPLTDVIEVAAGGVDGPDEQERAVTLTLVSEECLTLQLPDTEARNQLVTCLNMFSNQARLKKGT